jgi:hypothetical protein
MKRFLSFKHLLDLVVIELVLEARLKMGKFYSGKFIDQLE